MYKIRTMEIEDYEEIYRLWENSPGIRISPHDDSKESLTKFINKNPGTNFVAEVDGKISGTILAGNDGRIGIIYHLVVAEECRRKGIGKRLVEMTEAALKNEGINKTILATFRINVIGNDFWENVGYRIREDIYHRDKNLLEV